MRKALVVLLFIAAAAAVTILAFQQAPEEQFTGDVNEAGQPHGFGTWTHPGGASYTGEFKNGLKDGNGVWTHPDGITYDGQWQKDFYHGQGTLTLPDGASYTGEWYQGRKHGQGTYIWADGRKYIGQWQEDQMHGTGSKFFPDGSKFEGEFEKGRRSGYGIFTDAEGNQTSGRWVGNELQEIEVEEIILDHNSLALVAGGQAGTLKASIIPEDATDQRLIWRSSNTSVATVSNGRITPLREGTAVISVTTEGSDVEANCTVTVLPAEIKVTGISISSRTLTLEVGGSSHTLRAALQPSNTTNQVVVWSSDNPAVAVVGSTGTVTPLSPGRAVITVRSLDGGFTTTCTVTVRAAPEPEPNPEPPDNGSEGDTD